MLTAKAHRDMTHTGKATADDFSAFRRAFQGLLEGGALACILAQFPWSFKASPANRRVVAKLQEKLEPFPLVVEFRRAGWEGNRPTRRGSNCRGYRCRPSG